MATLGAGYVIHPAGDLTRAKQSRAGNRLWLFKLPISCYSGQRMLRQLLGIVDAMCCTSVSRQLAKLCTLTMLLPAQSSQLGPAAACRGFEPHRPVGSWGLDPTEAWTCLPIMKAVAAADRGTGILVTCPVCLQAMCVHWNPAQYPDRRFSSRKSHLIAASPLAGWLWPGSGRQLFLFWWREEQSSGSRRMKQTFVVMTMF